jgi:3-phosphoshikimate 1-carboxyvinyltransferase
MRAPQTVTVHPAPRVRGHVRPPGDKAISHRFALLAALAEGRSEIHGYSTGGDCASTLACLEALGVAVERLGHTSSGLSLAITGRGLGGLRAPDGQLDAGNSGSTMRMLAGVLTGHPFASTLSGDGSLRRRPMRRVIVPLERMGARIGSDDGRPPLTVEGTADPRPIDFSPEVPSAQVKTAILLAGLHAGGRTRVRESTPTRDHTERGLLAFGARVDREHDAIALDGRQRLTAVRLDVPGDVSSAAFWLAAAAAVPGSEIVIEDVGLNPTRTGILPILQRMGARLVVDARPAAAGEPAGTITVAHEALHAVEVTPDEVPGVIDELPVLGALATHGGELRVTGAHELRVKESDRIASLAEGLRNMGGDVEELPDGFHVRGRRRLRGGHVDAHHDHRLAMAFAVAALGADGPTTIHGAEAAAVSYPEFFGVLESLRA